MNSDIGHIVSTHRTALVWDYLDDITVRQASWMVRRGCSHSFWVSVSLHGTDQSIKIEDITVPTGQYMFERNVDLEEEQLTTLGKNLLRRVAEYARRLIAAKVTNQPTTSS